MTSSSAPSEGFDTIEQEFEARTRKAFVEGKADYIFIDSRHQRFQFEMAEYGVAQGWLTEGELVEIEEQYSQQRYRLTLAGRAHFGLLQEESSSGDAMVRETV